MPLLSWSASTDINGEFELNKVPVEVYHAFFQVSYRLRIHHHLDIIVISGKELVLGSSSGNRPLPWTKVVVATVIDKDATPQQYDHRQWAAPE